MNKITFAGALTIYEAIEAKNTLLAALEQGSAIEIDLSNLSELDTAGVQVIVGARQEATKKGLDLHIRHGLTSAEVFGCYRIGA
jgi:anti-anti-sigma regulatory factor